MSEWGNPLTRGLSRIMAATIGEDRRRSQASIAASMASTVNSPVEMYALLRSYVLNNGLYDRLGRALYDQATWSPAMLGLRTPANRAVAFYVAHLWPGSLPDGLPIETANEQIIDPIHQLWSWSNWGSKKQVAARHLAMYGDLFIQVAQAPDRRQVYMHLLEPETVTEMDLDVRGYLRYIRIDVPRTRRLPSGEIESMTHTEVWEYDSQTYRQWFYPARSITEPVSRLGTPAVAQPFSAFGIDFIPIVHAKFQDYGDDRGVGAFTLALDKIDEANREATRMAQMLFRYNKPTWALAANGVDATGRPLPPPRVDQSASVTGSGVAADPTVITLGDDRFVRLPGTATLQALIAPVNYDAALAINNAMLFELEKDMPELAYYRLFEAAPESGRALQIRLAPAVARALEARGNAETALIRAHQIALTIGVWLGLWPATIGAYQNPSDDQNFDHTFTEREVLPTSELEQAQADLAKAQAIQARRELGVSEKQGLVELGYTEEEIAAMQAETAGAAVEVPPGDLGAAAALFNAEMPELAGLLEASVVNGRVNGT